MSDDDAAATVDDQWAELFEVEPLTRLGLQADALCFKCKCSHGCSSLITDPELIGAQFWSVEATIASHGQGGALRAVLEQIDGFKMQLPALAGATELARSANDYERIAAEGKVASVLGLSGTAAIDGSMGVLRNLAELGVSYVSLTEDDVSGGDEQFDQLVREANRLGVLLHADADVSTVTARLVAASAAPVLVSTSARQQLPPDLVEQLRQKDALVMALAPTEGSAVADHVVNLARAVGIDNVGFATGSLVGAGTGQHPSVFSKVFRDLKMNDFRGGELDKITGGNFLRVWRAAERAGDR